MRLKCPQNMASRLVTRWVVQIFLVSVFTTMLLMIYLGHAEHDIKAKEDIERRKESIKEEIRTSKLTKLQSTLFRDPKRPPDGTYNINVTRSEHTPLQRDIPDARHEDCKKVHYDISVLPTLTVIIPFYNEALSMLLRAVHSILDRTPPSLLTEIIIIDDHSPNQDLGEPLDMYVKLLPKVKLIRTKKREGLIRARLIGASIARGEVIMFQDAHTENSVGWAEPILQEIYNDRTTIIQPHVDQIEAMSIEYIVSGNTVPRGGFSWDLRYTWMMMPAHELERLQMEAKRVGLSWESLPHRSTTLVGCALATNRDYFLSIGGFDDAMEIWGGENIELAFRNWMCGGRVLTHPCSRVGHTFKPFSYKFDGDREKIVQKNLMRIAELWMDDYKKFFLASTYTWEFKHTFFTEKDLETLNQRKELKKKMHCKSFEWFRTHICPEIPRPPSDAIYHGEVTNLKSEACWYVADDGYVGLTYLCFFHRVLPENQFYIDEHGRMMYRGQCVRFDPVMFLLKLGPCLTDFNRENWDVIATSFVEGQVKLQLNEPNKQVQQLCACQVTNVNKVHDREQMVQMVDCDSQNDFQHWRFQYKYSWNYNYDPPAQLR